MNSPERIFVIGDIHGCLNKLEQLWDRIDPRPDKDQLVFLGDYIDRGEDSSGVLDYLLQLKETYLNTIFLMGNHERMFIDFLAGVRVSDASNLKQIIAEGGGTRIFTNGVEYCIADLGKTQMQWQKYAISDLVARRERIKHDMDEWSRIPGKGRFPGIVELESIDRELSLLDNQFKRMWDARHVRPFLMVG